MSRPLVMLGMNPNGEGHEPLDPEGPSGKRLIEIIGRETFDKFERSNVLNRVFWSREFARKRTKEVRSQMAGKVVMVFGNEPWMTLSLPKATWLSTVTTDDTRWYKVPHPSGRNRLYNDPTWCTKVSKLFERVVRDHS